MLFFTVFYLSVAIVNAAVIPSPENFVNLNNINITRQAKQSYGFAEDAYLNFTELATKYGYPAEEHTLTTADGYIIKLFRIPYGNKEGDAKLGPPVLAVNGLMDSPDTWIFPGPGYGLGYLMVDAGYDLWCLNNRGGRYTRKHATLDPDKDVKFWKFSSDEQSQYDLPAAIEYILKVRNASSLAYIGHSLGTRLFFEMGLYNPDVYGKVNVMISLASTPWLTHSVTPFLRIITLILPQLEAVANTVGLQELFAQSSAINELPQLLCAGGADRITDKDINRLVCSVILFFLFGMDFDQMRPELTPVIFGHAPSGTSLQSLVHLGQGVHSPNFQRYDRGIEENIKAYGSPNPPQYDVSIVTTPVALIRGNTDMLSTPADVETLRRKLPNVVENYVVPRANWQHLNHIWGKDAPRLVGSKIRKLLKKYAV